jgi:hypothetical protein
LSEAFSAYLLHAEPSKKIILAIAAAQGVADRYLAHLMRDWLKTLAPEFTGLKKGDWKALLQFAVRAVDYLLIFLTACQLGDETQRQEALQKMSAADYQVALEFLEAPIHPVSFVRPDFLDTLLTSLEPVLDRVGDEDFVDFVKVMAGIGQTDRLAGVSGRVFTLQNKALTELEKIIKKEKFLPVDLIRAIKTQRYRLGPPYGLPSIFSRKSGSRPS